jgi:hypothetical protein
LGWRFTNLASYPVRSIAWRTLARVTPEISRFPTSTFETVGVDTPASSATSLIVMRFEVILELHLLLGGLVTGVSAGVGM